MSRRQRRRLTELQHRRNSIRPPTAGHGGQLSAVGSASSVRRTTRRQVSTRRHGRSTTSARRWSDVGSRPVGRDDVMPTCTTSIWRRPDVVVFTGMLSALPVCFYPIFWTDWPLTVTFCMHMHGSWPRLAWDWRSSCMLRSKVITRSVEPPVRAVLIANLRKSEIFADVAPCSEINH